jgi:hypothetical protein
MRTFHLEEIARRFPKLTVIGAHWGNPEYEWAAEVARWNPNVLFDLSGSTLTKIGDSPPLPNHGQPQKLCLCNFRMADYPEGMIMFSFTEKSCTYLGVLLPSTSLESPSPLNGLSQKNSASHPADGPSYGASHSSAYISSELVSRNMRGSSSGVRANELGSRSFSEATFWGLPSLMPILKTPSSVPPLAK